MEGLLSKLLPGPLSSEMWDAFNAYASTSSIFIVVVSFLIRNDTAIAIITLTIPNIIHTTLIGAMTTK